MIRAVVAARPTGMRSSETLDSTSFEPSEAFCLRTRRRVRYQGLSPFEDRGALGLSLVAPICRWAAAASARSARR